MNTKTCLNDLRDEALRIATEHGFTDATVGEDCALIGTEVSELFEDFRNGLKPADHHYDQYLGPADHHPQHPSGRPLKPTGIPSEAADIIIRVLHFSGKHGIDIDRAVREKMAYNASRPFKHGGKKL